ncbi:MAG: ParB/RepB/Spo0J family partition protein [Bacteroidales bacterium]|jgi:ParB family chromosome partitioning protein|nr:ParB/RepB/Spo0J family partition protein [Bacteroidales bacterium]
MALKKMGLGRGLDYLIQDNTTFEKDPTKVVDTGEIALVDIDKIHPNPTQPRTDFDDDKILELSQSIKALGIIQPLTLRKVGDTYEIISGERRYRASKLADLTQVPAYITEADDVKMLQMALVENIQREDLNSIEVALTYNRLIEECHLTQEQLSTQLGKARTTITNSLRLLKLPDEMQAALRNKSVTVGQIRPLISVENPDTQLDLFEKVLKYQLSARQVEQLVKDPDGYVFEDNNGEPNAENVDTPQDANVEKKVMVKKDRPKLSDDQKQVKQNFTQKFNVPVDLKVDGKGSCKLTFNLKSQEEYQRIVDILNNIQL